MIEILICVIIGGLAMAIIMCAISKECGNDRGKCTFCQEYDNEGIYPRDKSEFYAMRSRQLDVDLFDEEETDDVRYCPKCGRKL